MIQDRELVHASACATFFQSNRAFLCPTELEMYYLAAKLLAIAFKSCCFSRICPGSPHPPTPTESRSVLLTLISLQDPDSPSCSHHNYVNNLLWARTWTDQSTSLGQKI